MTNETPDQLSEAELHFVFDKFPCPEGSVFIECENEHGQSVNSGLWRERPDGYVELVLALARPLPEGEPVAWRYEAMNANRDWKIMFRDHRPDDHPERRNITPLYAAPLMAGDAVREEVEAAYIAGAADGMNRKPWEDSDDFFALQARDYVNTRVALNPIAPKGENT